MVRGFGSAARQLRADEAVRRLPWFAADNHIVAYGLGDWYDIGPDRPGYAQLTSNGVTATAIYYQDVKILERAARLLGKEADVRKYAALASDTNGRSREILR